MQHRERRVPDRSPQVLDSHYGLQLMRPVEKRAQGQRGNGGIGMRNDAICPSFACRAPVPFAKGPMVVDP